MSSDDPGMAGYEEFFDGGPAPDARSDYDADFDITTAMIRFGGGFVKKLGETWLHGDMQNKARLKAAFPDYWEEYRHIVQGLKSSNRIHSS